MAITTEQFDPSAAMTPTDASTRMFQHLQAEYRDIVKSRKHIFDNWDRDPTDPAFALEKDANAYKKMRKYHMIAAALDRRMDPVAGADWTIVAQSKEDEPYARAVEELIKQIPNFVQVRKNILEAVFQGVSFGEIIWPWTEIKTTNPLNGEVSRKMEIPPSGYIVPRAIEYRQKALFDFNKQGELVLKGEMYTTPESGTVIAEDHFVVCTYGVQDSTSSLMLYNSRWGRGEADTLYWPFFWVNAALRRLMTILERSGLVPIIDIHDGANETDIQNAIKMLTYFSASGALAKPANLDIKFEEIGGQSYEVMQSFIKYIDDAVAKILLGAPLSINVPEGNASRAMASVQLDPFSDKLIRDAGMIDECMTQQLVKPMLRMNYLGDKVDHPDFVVPKLKSNPRHPEDKGAVFQRELQIAQLKPISKRWFGEKYGIKWADPEDPDDSFGGPQMQQPGLPTPQGGTQGLDDASRFPQGTDYSEGPEEFVDTSDGERKVSESDRIFDAALKIGQAELSKVLGRLVKKKNRFHT